MNNFINKCKDWLSANGISGILGLILGIVLWIVGYKVWAGFAFGVFATRNWDILVDLFNKYKLILKNKLEKK